MSSSLRINHPFDVDEMDICKAYINTIMQGMFSIREDKTKGNCTNGNPFDFMIENKTKGM